MNAVAARISGSPAKKRQEFAMGIRNSDPFGSEAYIDELPTLKRKPPPEMLDMMRRARSLDAVARQFVDCVAFCLNALDVAPTDFAVMVDDAQDLDWDAYEPFFGCYLPPGAEITAPGRRFQFRLVVCANEPGVRAEVHEICESIHGRVYMALDGPGTMSNPPINTHFVWQVMPLDGLETMSTLGSPPAPRRRKEWRADRLQNRNDMA